MSFDGFFRALFDTGRALDAVIEAGHAGALVSVVSFEVKDVFGADLLAGFAAVAAVSLHVSYTHKT